MSFASLVEMQKVSWCKGIYITLLVLMPLFVLLLLPRGFEPAWWWFLLAVFVTGFLVLGSWMPSVPLNLIVVTAFWLMFLILEPQFARRSIPFVASALAIHGAIQTVIVLIARLVRASGSSG